MSHRLQLLVPKDLDDHIRKAAQRAGMSKGAWVRRAIEEALGRLPGAPGDGTDPVAQLATLGGPTGDLDRMLAEIEAGRT